MPGQSYYEASRRLVLRGTDGVVFVVDSSVSRLNDNVAAWKDMYSHLRSFGFDPDKMPIVVQFNKQDLPDALNPLAIKNLLHTNGKPVVNAVAVRGEGVLDTLKLITRAVMTNVQREIA